MNIKPRVGRPPKRADGGYSTLTVRLPAHVKNWLVDQAAAYDMSLTEFLVSLVEKNAR
jgi:predicted HicB family RNase H-like nuclease